MFPIAYEILHLCYHLRILWVFNEERSDFLAHYKITCSHITHNRKERKDVGSDQRQSQWCLILRRYYEAEVFKITFRAQSDPTKYWNLAKLFWFVMDPVLHKCTSGNKSR